METGGLECLGKTTSSERIKPGLERITEQPKATDKQEQGWMRSDITAFPQMLPSHSTTNWQILLKDDVCTPVLEKTLVTAFSGKGMFKQYLKQEKKTKRWLCKGVCIPRSLNIKDTAQESNVNNWI